MTYFIFSSLINAIICTFCCFFVLALNYKSRAVRSFALFNCCVALWSFFYFLSMIASSHDEALINSRILNTVALFIAPAFLNFCIHITNNTSRWIRHLLWTFVIVDIFILPFVPTDLFILKMQQNMLFPFWPVPGKLFIVILIGYTCLIPISLYLLRNKLMSTMGDTRKQYWVLYYSFLIGFLGGGTNFFPCFNIPIPPYGNAFASFFIFGFMFLILKYQIMDLKLALSRSFAYTLVIFLLTLFYFTGTFITEFYIKELIGYKSFAFSFLYAAITALAFVPLRNWLQNLVDKLFFRKSIDQIELENKLLIKEVAQTDHLKSISILASGMAHEIKNPLTVLKTFSEFLPKKLDDKEFLKKFAPILQQEVNRINSLVHDLLDYAKPAPVELKSTNIHNLIESTLEILSNELLKRNVKVIRKFEANQDLELRLDQNQIKQAFLNILMNSLDAMPKGGTITVSTALVRDTQNFSISIQDTGTGIDPDDLPHIFDPFFSSKDNGTGLGLSITQEIIKNHKGKITAESVWGSSTTFLIELPYES